MSRATATIVAAIALAAPLAVYAQQSHHAQTSQAGKAAKMTDAQKIRNAMSAAPAEIAKNATIMDWPDTPNGKPRQLRAGTNGWVCYPNSPQDVKGATSDDPMCLDKAWQAWAEALMSKTEPKTAEPGIGYMLRGDKRGSNTDPFATAPTPDNQWVVSPGHVMVLFPDPKALDAYPADPKAGGPWVMWRAPPTPT